MNKLINHKPEPVNPQLLSQYRQYKEDKLNKHMRLFMDNGRNGVECLVCKTQLEIGCPFVPFSVPSESRDRNGRLLRSTLKYLENKKAAIKWFQERHWQSCIRYFGI